MAERDSKSTASHGLNSGKWAQIVSMNRCLRALASSCKILWRLNTFLRDLNVRSSPALSLILQDLKLPILIAAPAFLGPDFQSKRSTNNAALCLLAALISKLENVLTCAGSPFNLGFCLILYAFAIFLLCSYLLNSCSAWHCWYLRVQYLILKNANPINFACAILGIV